MGQFNNPVIVQPRQNLWANTLPQLVQSLALAKIQHNWSMDIADKKIAAAGVAATIEQKQQQQLETRKETAASNLQTQKDTAAEKRVELKAEQARETATQNLIDTGKLRKVPDYEQHFLKQPQLDQLVEFKGNRYAPAAEEPTGTPSDFEMAYQQALTKNPKLTRAGFKQTQWFNQEAASNRRLELSGIESAFGPPRDKAGQIMSLDPAKRRSRLAGWLGRGRKAEIKRHKLTPDELASLDQRIMTSLGIEQELQFAIVESMRLGATSEQILKKIKSYKAQ